MKYLEFIAIRFHIVAKLENLREFVVMLCVCEQSIVNYENIHSECNAERHFERKRLSTDHSIFSMVLKYTRMTSG